ncbi:PIR Superfamily Protein [Plasmodium ovale curtisi]|uniref:PIR Superfamily Protein n=1 Tax=Plasmodium ovale curtisi TaxID=864141 RepID=A0A1A8XBG8_PLAOA|nr:PIR Superfamily Protein [Plasmodium ovale curtisi]
MNKKNNQYCDYIRDSVKLYKEMKKENGSSIYTEDVMKFEEKFKNYELSFLNDNCPNKPVLKKLGEYKIYEDYNRRENIDDNCSYCDDLFMLKKYYLGINELCKMFARNLYEIKDKNDRKDRCEYLYYWIYDKIWKIFSNHSGFIRDNDAVVKLHNAGYNISSKIRMHDSYIHWNPENNFGEWKEEKYLHDFFKNSKYINCDESFDKEQCDNYFKYVFFIKGLYKRHIKSCCISRKFTPFGYFLHKKVLIKKQIEKNFYDEDIQNLSHHHRKRENTNSKSRRYRLAYNSV